MIINFADAMSIEKCCQIIKDYIDEKKDAHDVLCAESDLEQCCNDFADKIQKQEDAYDVATMPQKRYICLHPKTNNVSSFLKEPIFLPALPTPVPLV